MRNSHLLTKQLNWLGNMTVDATVGFVFSSFLFITLSGVKFNYGTQQLQSDGGQIAQAVTRGYESRHQPFSSSSFIIIRRYQSKGKLIKINLSCQQQSNGLINYKVLYKQQTKL